MRRQAVSFPHFQFSFICPMQKRKLFMPRFKEIIKMCLPYGFVEYLKDGYISAYFASKKIFEKYYAPKYGKNTFPLKEKTAKRIIYMADGRQRACGLADRLRGIVSLYKISKELNVDFKINMTSPVDLSNYLVPNKYNWIIDENEIVYNIKESVIYDFWDQTAEHFAFQTIKSMLKKWNQMHITTNMCIADKEYGELFNELFKSSHELQGKIDCCLSEIGCDFISVTFRFQELLGDFLEECGPAVLPDAERIVLIRRCIDHLMEIYKENNYKKILVTSDSITFLNKAKEFDFVYVIPGKIAHIDHHLMFEKEVYMKSFLDYFLLTYSKMAYLVVDGQMYNSEFAYRAALHNLPYKIKRY